VQQANLSATEFYQKMKDDYLPQIQQIKGVAEITILGGEEREIQVKVNQEKIETLQNFNGSSCRSY
jgi:HAE1 family hydrophobic/amphiphilic exporter-1